VSFVRPAPVTELAVSRSRSREATRRAPAPLLVGLAVFVACLAWMPSLMDRLDPLTGDEPFYVMTGISLIEDGDLDEQNNYDARHFDRFYPLPGIARDGWPGFPDPLPPHASQTDRDGLYSKHGPGMALLVAVPFAVGGRPLVLLVLAGIAAAVAGNATALAARYAAAPVAAAVGLALALTNPLASFSLLIFPEMSAALCVTYAVRRLLAPTNAVWQWFAVGAVAAALPWLHYRLAPVSVVLVVLALVRHRRGVLGWAGVAALALPVPAALILGGWYVYLYGGPLPPSTDHAGFSGPADSVNNLFGTFLDQQWGAFVHNPLLLLAATAFVPFAAHRPKDAATLLAVAVPYLALVVTYRVWWGEWNPPARYLTDIVPLAAAPLAWWLNRIHRAVAWPVLAAFAAPALLVMAAFVRDPQRMYNHPDGTSNLFELWQARTGLALTEWVPSFVFYSASPDGERVFAAFVLVGLLAALPAAAMALVDRTSSTETGAGGR